MRRSFVPRDYPVTVIYHLLIILYFPFITNNETIRRSTESDYECISECECIGVLRHMQRYFSYICDDTDVQGV